MAELDGVWRVERTGGLLPPLVGVRKRIHGDSGETLVGRLRGPAFRVDGRALRYRAPFQGFVDLLEADEAGFSGRATFRGRGFGRFVMRLPPSS
jgi:hypothetical protein